MTVNKVFEGVSNWLAATLSRINVFLASPEFKRFVDRLANWMRGILLWCLGVIRGLVEATVRFVKSDNFQDGLRAARERFSLGLKVLLGAIESLVLWLYAVATSGPVKTGLAAIALKINRYLPKQAQKILAIATIVVVVIVLSLWEAEVEQGVKTPGLIAIPSEVPRFDEFPAGRERKAAFFGYFLPLVQHQNQSILGLRQRLQDWYQNPEDVTSGEADEIAEIATRYRLDGFDIDNDQSWQQLLSRVDIVPPSLALAQAANESAWGTSRFARKAQNYFGQWCFSRGCGLVPQKRDANKTHEVAAFDSPQQSVERYILNLNRNSAYRTLRDIRAQLRKEGEPVTGYELAAGLKRYSERGPAYIDELREMIEFNKLTRYDVL